MTIAKLAEALANAQSQILAAKKDNINPHFKNRYADLASVWDACRGPLTANGLSVAQVLDFRDGLTGVSTKLLHTSGETIEGFMPLPVMPNANAQMVGSAVTYIRRYALAAMVGVCPDDDDGNAASNPAPQPVKRETAAEIQAANPELKVLAPEGLSKEPAKFWSNEKLIVSLPLKMVQAVAANGGQWSPEVWTWWKDAFSKAINKAPSITHIDRLFNDNDHILTQLPAVELEGYRAAGEIRKQQHKEFA